MKSEVSVENPGINNKLSLSIKGFREATVLITIILFSVLLSFIAPNFLTINNIRTTAIGMCADGIIAIAVTVALVAGGLDLSVGSVLGLSSVVAGSAYLAGANIWIGCLLAIAVSVLCGIINGLFIGKIGINPFIITLGMMGIVRGAAYVATQGSPQSLSSVPEAFKFLGRGSILGIPIIVIVFIVLAIIGDYMMRNSLPLRKVFFIGSNEKAAVLSGINVPRVKMGVYILTALFSSIAGLLTLSRFGVATPTAGESTEMRVISAAVIGGASLNGGEGTIFGTMLGIVLLNLINNALVLLKVSVYWQALISGVILIAAVTIDFVSHKKRAVKLISK